MHDKDPFWAKSVSVCWNYLHVVTVSRLLRIYRPMLCFFTTHYSLRLIVRSELDVPTFATRRLHACHPAAEGGTVGEKCPGILPKCRLPRYI
jgi:hypothetical protein